MNKSEFKKRIIIGSANFDQKYGIKNKKINNEEITKIINFAISNKIFMIDTAHAYLKTNEIFKNIDRRFKFITKIKLDKQWTSLNFCKRILKSHLTSFKNKKIQTLLIHDIKILYTKFGSRIFKNLLILKKNKYFKKIGVSIYDPKCLNYITSSYKIDIVQCPYNIFDKRIINSGWFRKLKKKKIQVHARSIFLQGLLVDSDLHKNKYFKEWKSIFSNWFKYLIKNKISPVQYCINDLLSHDFDKIIIGINSEDNLKEIFNFKVLKKKFKFINMSASESKLIDPRKWKI